MCDMKVPEDIPHFLFICPWSKYITPRQMLFNSLETHTLYNRFSHLQTLTKTLLDCNLTTKPIEKLQTIYTIIHKMYKLREKEPRVKLKLPLPNSTSMVPNTPSQPPLPHIGFI